MVLKWSVGQRLKNFLIIKEKGVDLNGKVKGKRFYKNAKNTCDFSREMNWHDYFTKMIAFQ